MNVRPSGLTRKQWEGVEAALPQIRKLARKLAGRLTGTGLCADELDTMAQDFFVSRARRWDPDRGTTLYNFAHSDVELDVMRAACAADRGAAECSRAMSLQEETIVETDLATLWGESLEELEARAVALGQEQALAGLFGYSAAQRAANPEAEYGSRELVEVMKRAASTEDPRAADLLGLLYEQDLTWDEASAQVHLDKRQAQRIVARAFARLRSIFGPREQRAPP